MLESVSYPGQCKVFCRPKSGEEKVPGAGDSLSAESRGEAVGADGGVLDSS